MKQVLPNYIKQNEKLRQILMDQKGGIMKYLVIHLDANGTAKLFSDYQNLCVEIFFEAHKWDINMVWAGDEMTRAALGFEHLFKELQYKKALESDMINMPAEASELVEDFTEQYLTYAYKQNRRRWHPNGMTSTEIYQEIIEQFQFSGLHYKCMKLILKEHHGIIDVNTATDLWTEFSIIQWSNQLTLSINNHMRKAVAKMLEGKTDEQCRDMAIETMRKVRSFSQMIYTNTVVKDLRDINSTKEADRRESDGKWLRDVAKHTVLEEYSARVKRPSMRFHFADFVNLLENVGRIWAAQLLTHGIDMKELEKQECCILTRSDNPAYYIDKFFSDDLPGHYCIANTKQAEELLKKIHSSQSYYTGNSDEEKLKKLETTNSIIKTRAQSGALRINLLELHSFINVHFVNEIKHKYEWYALKYFLEKYELLSKCDNKQFAKQMNHEEWFGKIREDIHCSSNEMNTYNYLNTIHYEQWVNKEIPKGSHATKRAVWNIYNIYTTLELYHDKIIKKVIK